MKLYQVPEDSPVGQLVNRIEADCTARGLVLRRFQANKGNHACVVSYAIMTPEQNDGVLYYGNPRDPKHSVPNDCPGVWFDNLEGKTERCQAYRQLTILARKANIMV